MPGTIGPRHDSVICGYRISPRPFLGRATHDLVSNSSVRHGSVVPGMARFPIPDYAWHHWFLAPLVAPLVSCPAFSFLSSFTSVYSHYLAAIAICEHGFEF